MLFYILLLLTAGIGIYGLHTYIFETFLVNEDGKYNDVHAGYLRSAGYALFIIVVLSPLYMEFAGTPAADKYVAYEDDVRSLNLATLTVFSDAEPFSIRTTDQITPLNMLSVVVMVDGEPRILLYEFNLGYVQDPDLYWEYKQKGAVPSLDGRSERWRMAAYTFHHNHEAEIRQIARLGDRDGVQACKRLGKFIKNEFRHSPVIEVTRGSCYLN